MVSFNEALSLVLPFVPGCPEPIAIEGLRQATIDFCQRTQMWKDIDSFTLGGTGDVCTPTGSVLIKIVEARFDGRLLEPITTQELSHLNQSEDWRVVEGQPKYITQTEQDTVTISPKARGKLMLSMVLAPSFDAELIPRFIMNRYRQVIASGAIAYAMMLPGEDYYNPELSMIFSERFNQHLNHLSITGRKGQQNGPIRTRSQYF